jgi:membrane-associated phospholipid phosphatase
VALSGHHGHFLAEHHRISRSLGQDGGGYITSRLINIPHHSTILPAFHAYRRIPDFLLRLQVSPSWGRTQPRIGQTNILDRFIPAGWRPPIWVKVLPALENILYGANLSNILSAHKTTALDLLAWFPYGLGHFGAPFVCSAIMFIWGPPTTVTTFGFAFGYMNLFGVITQVLLPCSPPWYENMYGLAPANYSMKGSPAGLARIDAFLGLDLYTSGFTASPMVFGAFPSLHAATSTLEAMFMSHVFPKLTPLFAFYVMWLWWATMYLSHHYAIDLVAGSLLAGIIFHFTKAKSLPRLQPDKNYRWDYDYIEVGESHSDYGYDLAGLDGPGPDSDEWTIGSSSSVSSGSLSPVEENQSVWTDAYSNHER